MQLLELTPEQMKIAKDAVAARFLNNSVAYQCIPMEVIGKNETTIRLNQYDYNESRVVDNLTLTLCEPSAVINLSRAQRDEANLHRALTTINRQTSELARTFDALAFVGLEEFSRRKLANVEIPSIEGKNFLSLREAAIQVEGEEGREPILVDPPNSQESLVSAAFEAVFCLEKYGYYSTYISVWGEQIWSLLNRPNKGDLVRPIRILEDTIHKFYRSTTLPPDEALVFSLDGETLKYVVAAGIPENMNMEEEEMSMQEEYLFFEPLRIATNARGEEIYKYRCRYRGVPYIQENRSIVRIKFALESPAC